MYGTLPAVSSTREGRTETARPGRRDELLKELEIAGRAVGAAAVMFHAALAERRGLSATEEKALDLLERFGPLTAGELVERSGLAPASVTGLVDRLEAKGFARRVPHPKDRRRILVEIDAERVAEDLAPLFADWGRSLDELYAGYTDEQLDTILHFLTESARRQREATARLGK
jgi:DNA-binding MarR family transcriptional regulator